MNSLLVGPVLFPDDGQYRCNQCRACLECRLPCEAPLPYRFSAVYANTGHEAELYDAHEERRPHSVLSATWRAWTWELPNWSPRYYDRLTQMEPRSFYADPA